MSMMPVKNPTNHGWKEEDGKLLPIGTTLSFANEVFHLDWSALSQLRETPLTPLRSPCKRVETKLKSTH